MATKSQTKQLGLIGYPLSHSFSKKYFAEKFEQEGIEGWHYDLFPLDNIDKLPLLLEQEPTLVGLNVTIPYKEAVIPYLDKIDESAAFGAVNTIKIEDGKLTGFNTDVYGFEHSLIPFLKPYHKQALILGTGGAAKAVASVLNKLNIAHQYVSRTPSNQQLSYDNLNKNIIESHLLIINTTPLGMQPNIKSFPKLAYKYITSRHVLYDLVYNPEKTIFLNQGKYYGADIKNGLEMLYLQAERAWSIWQT